MSSQFNDTEDDTPLYTRRSGGGEYPVDIGRADEIAKPQHVEREVTLNTGIVLALFFALALLCAVFFGFGYSIGHKSVPPAMADADTAPADNTAPASTSAKPSPGSPAAQPVPEYVPRAGTEHATAAITKPLPAPAVAGTAAAAPATAGTSVGPAHTPPAAVRITPAAAAVPLATPPAAATAGTMYVQIAAVSHQEDADVLLSALRRRGYAVQTRSETADKLIHVQVGPFSNRKEADAMRQKLAGDGYNAFIK